MHRVLTEEDGFHIKPRALLRIRRHHKWLLRASVPKKNGRSKNNSQSPSAELPQRGQLHNDGQQHDESSAGDPGGESSLRPAVDEGNDTDDDDSIDPGAAQLMEARRRKMETESHDRWASKKRRRRTRPYGGMPADPPGPPRFRSETTVAESLTILGLDKTLYGAVRDKFQSICETMHITKKTVAGPNLWEEAKSKLVAEFPHLQHVMWIGDDLERNKLALDVICCDVAKRMRTVGDRGQKLADAKQVLGMNPDELREVKATFFKLLENDGATSKVLLGNERWEELKSKWIEQSEMLRTMLTRLYDPAEEMKRNTAVETLARDVMKRLRDSRRGRKNPRTKGKGATDDTEDVLFDHGPDTVDFNSILVPDQDHRPRMSSNHLVDAQMHAGMQIPIDNTQLDAQLLMHPNAQTGFMGTHQQFIPTPTPMVRMPQMAAMSPMPTAPSPYDTAQAAVFDMPASNTGLRAVYLRELAHDHMGPFGETWIAWLTSASLEELRHVAAQKLPGSTCTEVVGLVKMPLMEGYLPLMIQNDEQLSAHLVQENPPTFHVRLSFQLGDHL